MKTYNKNALLKLIRKTLPDVPVFYCSGYEDVNHIVTMSKTLPVSQKVKDFVSFAMEHFKAKDSIYVFFDPKMRVYTIQRSPFDVESEYFNRLRVGNKQNLLKLVERFLVNKKKMSRECMICYEEMLLTDAKLSDVKAKLFDRVVAECYNNPYRMSCTRCQNTWCCRCNFKMLDEMERFCCPFCRNTFSEDLVRCWKNKKFQDSVLTTYEYING